MTLSILALNRDTHALGCAAATGNIGVGGWVLRSATGIGAAATQGFSVSHLWGDRAMTLLAAGETASAVVDTLTREDPGRDFRQLTVLDTHGTAAAWTGVSNTEFKSHLIEEGVVVAGNWLAGEQVLPSMLDAYHSQANQSEPFAWRLLNVLDAGIKAGGDSRGTLSAAIRVVDKAAPPLDLRIDYDKKPLAALHALLERVSSEPYSGWIKQVPTHTDPFRF